MMCSFGYDNVTVGLCLGWFIGAGSFGSMIFGYITDKTGKLEEISKILYATSSIAYIILVLVCKLVNFLTFILDCLVLRVNEKYIKMKKEEIDRRQNKCKR